MVDLVTAMRTVVEGRDGDEFFRAARLAIDGYEKVTPLEPGERAILGELLAARMCAALVIPASRAALYDDPDSLQPGVRERARRPPPPRKSARRKSSGSWVVASRGGLVRARAGGAAHAGNRACDDELFYREPLHLVRGDGVWLFDADGRRYLDAYNNVPTVGHCHPRVVEAVVRQARRLNTNMRYLHETAFEVAERLIATTAGALDVVMFVNSGSEANDLAWRIARAVTGGSGGIASDWAYHGISDAIHALTPSDWGSDRTPEHVRTWRPRVLCGRLRTGHSRASRTQGSHQPRPYSTAFSPVAASSTFHLRWRRSSSASRTRPVRYGSPTRSSRALAGPALRPVGVPAPWDRARHRHAR